MDFLSFFHIIAMADLGITAIIFAILSVALSVASYFLAPKPRANKSGANYTSVKENEPIPYAFGTIRVYGTFIYPQTKAGLGLRYIGDTGIPVGHWAQLICWGPIKALHRVYKEDCTIWKPSLPLQYDSSVHVYSYASLRMAQAPTTNKADLCRFYFGTPTQKADGTNPIGANTNNLYEWIPAASRGRLPDWPGICYGVMHYISINSGAVPNMSFEVERPPQAPELDQANASIGYDANPAHVIWELSTNDLYGAGFPPSEFDVNSFNEAAALLKAEGRGISGVLTSSENFEDLIQNILYHIDGGLIRRDGKWYLKLIRKDKLNPIANNFGYDPTTLPIIPSTAIGDSFKIQYGTKAQTVAWIDAEFNDKTLDYQDSVIPIANIGAAMDNLREAKRTKLLLPFFTNATTASKVAAQKGQILMTPHDAIECDILRSNSWRLEWGDVIRINYPLANISASRCWRVIEVSRSPAGITYTHVKLAEEIGQVDHSLVVTDNEIQDYTNNDINVSLRYHLPVEPPHHLNLTEEFYVGHAAGREFSSYNQYLLYGGATSTSITFPYKNPAYFSAAGTLLTAITKEGFRHSVNGIEITLLANEEDFVTLATEPVVDDDRISGRRFGIIVDKTNTLKQEFICYQQVEKTNSNPSTYALRNVLRGVLGTTIKDWPDNAMVFLFKNGVFPNKFVLNGWTYNKDIFMRGVPVSFAGNLNSSFQPVDVLSVKLRASYPYAATNVLVNYQQPMFSTYNKTQSIRVLWNRHSRFAGCGLNEMFNFVTQPVNEGFVKVKITNASNVSQSYTLNPPSVMAGGGFYGGMEYCDIPPVTSLGWTGGDITIKVTTSIIKNSIAFDTDSETMLVKEAV